MSLLTRLFAAGAAVTLAGCTAREPETAAPRADNPFAPATQLVATLAEGGRHVDLSWKSGSPEATGGFLEFNMNPGEDFTILEFTTPEMTSIRHPDVAPETRFGYRLRHFFGRASNVVEITTGPAPEKLVAEDEGPLGPAERSTEARPSLRAIASLDVARPAGLTAALSSPTTVDLRWQDRAGDEEGYLVEFSADPAQPFRVCALLPSDTASFRKIRLAGSTRYRFRVRAYFLGEPSNVATVTTPAERASGARP